MDNYARVLVPLEEAHLHSHSARTGRVEFEARDDEGDEDELSSVAKDDEGEREGMLLMDAAEYTIEGLRTAMRHGKRGRWTDYESES